MENDENTNSRPGSSFLKNILNHEFIISAIVPLVIFYIFNHFKMRLNGIILSGCWCVCVVVVKLVREHKLNVIALLAGVFSAVGLVGTIISRNPSFYLISPIVIDILYALIFLGSLFTSRPFIQIIAEDSHIALFSDEFRRTRKYKSAWRILTAAWGILNITQALLRVVLLHSVSMGLYYSINTIYSHISSPLLLGFSYIFPRWYWRRCKVPEKLS